MISTKSALLAGALLALLPVASWAQSSGSPGLLLAQQDQQGKPGEKPGQKKPDEHHPAVGNKPVQPAAPAAQGQPSQMKQPTVQEQQKRQTQPTAQTPTPSGQQGVGQTQQPAAQVQTPTTQLPNQKQEKPAVGQRPGQMQTQTPQTPTAQQPNPAFGQRPGQPQSPTAQSPQPASTPMGRTAVAPPTNQVRQSQDFIRGPGQQPSKGLETLKQERHEVHEGNRTIIQEQDRTIVEEGGHAFIRHNEADRFAVNARSVQNQQRGNETISIVVRADGTRIQNIVDADGRLIRRSRFDANGREIVIIDNSWVTPQASVNFVVDLPAPIINIPRERYIVDMDHAVAADIFAALTAPPLERIARRYSLDEIRYSVMLRDRMPRVDLDTITFDTGSWQIGPDQFDKLAVVADAMQRAIARNPREVFLIEGHTDAVGSDVDNLSLSDRRAETVAVVLTEQFHLPPENLATQGYGSQFLKIQTPAPERQNRRVAVRRITPLLEPDERAGG
jgi:outer membrane protein OmpA-like peptidoglycan-associated protein